MVGVAGSSKGCNTCRKRKIHCDGDRPSCARCRKTNRVCGGYERERHFKNLSALDRETFDSGTGGTTVTTARITPQDQNIEGIRHAAGLAEVFIDFLANYIPRRKEEGEEGEGEGHDTRLQNEQKTQQVSWLQAIDPSSLENSASLDLAILALSLSCLGRRHGDERLRREGTANYGRALRRLQDSLSHHSLLLEEQTLASCMALSIFEACLPFSGKNTCGWVSHVEGMARLVELRGPESHMTGSSHRLFLGFRSTAITHALATRKSIFLARPDWLTVPWKIHPKSDLDRLQDIMAQIATLLEKAERLRTASTTTTAAAVPERTALVQEGRTFHSQLQTWYQRLVRKHAGCGALYWERPVSARFHLPIPSVFTTSLQFPTFEIARLHLSYWTMLLLLRTSILSLALRESYPSDTDTDAAPPSPPSSPPPEVPDLPDHHLATMICKSMDFFLSDDARIMGPQNVFFALRVATHVFSRAAAAATTTTAGTPHHHLRIVEWCRAVFDELDRRGYSLGRILAACPWDEIPALLSPRNQGMTSQQQRPGAGVELGDMGEGYGQG
ncbi:hypothetical protein Z517_04920 [Fonsecaea pedrosoi CBS 271.37]|uniref:Zn(2)-C6 fungal-type domain-containing protein n=1 Tax=Fonsecaea pedrosoi CBS 271.37 TaxID=1442368 RepID=A0A0D2HBG0_9EURO|nr:uncharacterized protein Z517_04920 [Fonsecaea pedrosoi CBS 271.37]KIW81894.1 hypothetical protein Z517_04920 [Fonsecaea pedrosoi CBS 271.37]